MSVSGRVNPYAPGSVGLAGVVLFLIGYRWIGSGVIVGALLDYINGVLLSRRVDFAADLADVGRALLVMQLGLLVTCTIIAIATIILLHFSLAMAVACAAGFGVAQLAMLFAFYWTHGRSDAGVESPAINREAT
jgi:hypothetical protein